VASTPTLVNTGAALPVPIVLGALAGLVNWLSRS